MTLQCGKMLLLSELSLWCPCRIDKSHQKELRSGLLHQHPSCRALVFTLSTSFIHNPTMCPHRTRDLMSLCPLIARTQLREKKKHHLSNTTPPPNPNDKTKITPKGTIRTPKCKGTFLPPAIKSVMLSKLPWEVCEHVIEL